MTISAHLIVTSAVTAKLVSRPPTFMNSLAIFLIAFLGHYVLDLIPHWDYRLSSIHRVPSGDERQKRKFAFIINRRAIFTDAAKILVDGLLGLLFVVLILGWPNSWARFWTLILVIIGGLLPDFIEIFYIIWRRRESHLPHTLHSRIQAERRFDRSPLKGVILQIITIVIIVIILFKINGY
jgi:hypothetical protein